MRKATCILIAVVALITAPTYAEDAAPSDARLAAATDFLEAQGVKNLLTSMTDNMIAAEIKLVKAQHPNLDDNTLKTFETTYVEEINNGLNDGADGYLKFVATVYARHFTVEELTTMTQFYQSDVGKKYIATIPVVMNEMGAEGIQWGQAVAAQALERTMDRLKKNGVNL
jgi:hypothetical protein